MPDKVTMLAFDLGASTGRALIGEWTYATGADAKGADARDADAKNAKDTVAAKRRRKLYVTEIHRFPNEPVRVGKHLHWDILRLLHEIKNGIRIAFREGYKPTTFGIDTWGVDFGLLDANGELLGNPYHYRNPQHEGLVEEVCALIGKEQLYAQSGLQFMPFNTIYQLYAMVKAGSPKLRAAETLLLTPDLLVYMLTNKRSCEFTMATTTQLYNPKTRSWNTPLLDQLQIPKGLFLPPVPPGTKIGALSEEVCRELNVPALEAIAVATHDTESAVAAIPAGDEPFVYLVCGTWSLLGTERTEPLITSETLRYDFSNEGGAGDTFQLLKNIMGLWILQECKREWDERALHDNPLTWSELVESAKQAEPFRCLINPDDLYFYAPGNMEERVKTYCSKSGQPIPQTPGEVTRCVLESLALRYRHAVEQLEDVTGMRYSRLHMVGGGVQNRLLCQFTANALRREVWAGPVEASAIGNLTVQLMSQGYCENLRAARQLVADSFDVTVYKPDQPEGWEQAYQSYLKLVSGE